MHAETLIAALADSRGRELTFRRPCDFNHGNPAAYFDGFDFLEAGVAEVMLVFCAGCGGLVMHRRLNVLYAFDCTPEHMTICGYPIHSVPFDQKLRARGQA